MLISINKKHFVLIEIYKNSFDLEDFKNKYISELFDMATYIIGDFVDKNMRLKGFKVKDIKEAKINYLTNSCAFDAPYFILKAVNSNYNIEKHRIYTPKEYYTFKLEKVPFVYDDLILTSNPYKTMPLRYDLRNYDMINLECKRADILNIIKEDQATRQQTKRRGNYARFK